MQFNKDNKQTSNANEQTSENAPSRECPETVNVATGRGFGGSQDPNLGVRMPEPRSPIVNPRKLEHRFRMIHAGIPFTLL